MTQRAKLYRKFVENRPLTFAEFCALLEAFGYEAQRTTGSHRVYYRSDIRDSRIIQPRGKDAKDYQLRQFADIVEAYGLKMER